jgi:hypothetical protein
MRGHNARLFSARLETDPFSPHHSSVLQISSAPSRVEELAGELEELELQAHPQDEDVAPAVGALQEGVAAMVLQEGAIQGQEAQGAEVRGEAGVAGEGRGEGEGGGAGEGETGREERKGSRGQRGGPRVHKRQSGGGKREKGVGDKAKGTAAYHANRKRKLKKVKKE